MISSSWNSNSRYSWATREQGNLTLVGHRDYFVLLADEAYDIKVSGLDSAIQEADRVFPPPGWAWGQGEWASTGWRVKLGSKGWLIYREEGTLASKQHYPRADLARKWCDVRADRVGINLRGPKPTKVA